jgi:hypothetical protein
MPIPVPGFPTLPCGFVQQTLAGGVPQQAHAHILALPTIHGVVWQVSRQERVAHAHEVLKSPFLGA